jgi:hypothetical protein
VESINGKFATFEESTIFMIFPNNASITQSVNAQRTYAKQHPFPSYKERLAALKALQELVQSNEKALCDAVYLDFK